MRISYSDEEDVPGQFALWQANCQRSIKGKKGQAALRELEAALLALPEKRLIEGKLQDRQGEVCSLGALARYKNHEMPVDETSDGDWDDDDGDMEEFGVELGMPRLVAWKVVCKNDVEIDGHYVTLAGPYRWYAEIPKVYMPVTPEMRYEKMLAWVQATTQRTCAIEKCGCWKCEAEKRKEIDRVIGTE